MDNTKIEWCDSTWNPVTGCRHGCEYCYARRIANRFRGCERHEKPGTVKVIGDEYALFYEDELPRFELTEEQVRLTKNRKLVPAPYPFGFAPTFHRYKLDEPQHWREPRTVFVCSMADLFGGWVPDELIEDVFAACKSAPQHRYIFLTKNPSRYQDLADADKLPVGENYWYGATVTSGEPKAFLDGTYNTFFSAEPLLGPLEIRPDTFGGAKLLIVGAETGNRKGKVTPDKEWIDTICAAADLMHTPVFMKDSLIPIVGCMRRELPWKRGAGGGGMIKMFLCAECLQVMRKGYEVKAEHSRERCQCDMCRKLVYGFKCLVKTGGAEYEPG